MIKAWNLALILGTIGVILKTGDILDLYRVNRGSHFPRWPPVNIIDQYVNHIQPITVDIAVENNTWYL